MHDDKHSNLEFHYVQLKYSQNLIMPMWPSTHGMLKLHIECNQWSMNGHKTLKHNWIDSHCFNYAFCFGLETIEPFSITPCLCFFFFSYHRYYFGFHPSPIFCTLHVHFPFHLVLVMEELRGKHNKPLHARFIWNESIL